MVEGLDLFSSSAPETDYGRLQRTLKSEIHCRGIGIHSGRPARLTIRPATANQGVSFRREDLDCEIPALYSAVGDTRFCTTLVSQTNPNVQVSTVEHLLAALAGMGIDNAVISLDGPEVPIFDGSSAPFLFLLDSVGFVDQDAPRTVIPIRETVRVTDGDAWAELRPLGGSAPRAGGSLELKVSISFSAQAIGDQSARMMLSPATFRSQLASARTFTLGSEVSRLMASGLARGGSLDNAVVVEGSEVLNPGGLRMSGEFINHKMLDVVGDLSLAGARIHGQYVAHRPSHTLNNRLLRALFAGAQFSDRTESLAPAVAA